MEIEKQLPSLSNLSNKARFEIELDFVQSLANPFYIKYLAQHHYFQKKSFVNFLSYLQYWKETDYIQFIQYPVCLYYLEMLQTYQFRKACENPEIMNEIIEQHHCHFSYYKTLRTPVVPKSNEEQKPMEIEENKS
ncbi:Mediator of RNA polymerase II transcription subunit 31 [Entamoeba marina]